MELVTLREYLEQRVTAIETLLDTKIEALRDERQIVTSSQQLALEKAQASTQEAVHQVALTMDHRLEGVNEFRAQLSDQTATFVTREVLDTRMSEIDKRIGSIESALAEQHGAMHEDLGGDGAAVPDYKATTRFAKEPQVAIVGFVISVGLTAVVLLANGVIK